MDSITKRINDYRAGGSMHKYLGRALQRAGQTPETLGIASAEDYVRVSNEIVDAALVRAAELASEYGDMIDAETVIVRVARRAR